MAKNKVKEEPIETQLWKAADKLRKNIDAAEYKHIVLGILTAAEVIEEMISIAKEIKRAGKEPEEMGLSEYEYGFYTAIAHNQSARELMQKDDLRQLAIVIYENVKKNATIDWRIKESVRSKLRVTIKRNLNKYGYPPDMQQLATYTVLKQPELIANELLS